MASLIGGHFGNGVKNKSIFDKWIWLFDTPS